MNTTSKTISVIYSDERLRTLVEEFITMQKHEFSSLLKTFAPMSSIGLRRRAKQLLLVSMRATSLMLPIVKE